MAAVQVVSQVVGDHLVVEELGDELVIFDRRTSKAHMLDARSAAIWKAAGAAATVDSLVVHAGGDPVVARAVVILAALDLERAGLLVTNGLKTKAVSRRGLLKTIGTSVAAPLVISILAPTSSSAATMCNTSTDGGPTGNDRPLVGGTCGTNCSTPLGTFRCLSSSSGAAAADGCSCNNNNDCCSGNCISNICAP